MLVRNIAGKALASPATNGSPNLAKISAQPIAAAAAIPLAKRIGNGTLLDPFGDGRVLMLKKTETKIKKNKPSNPKINGLKSIEVV